MSPDSASVLFYFISTALLQGAGTFSRDMTKTKSLQCRDFTWALHMEKSISPLFPGPREGGGRGCK